MQELHSQPDFDGLDQEIQADSSLTAFKVSYVEVEVVPREQLQQQMEAQYNKHMEQPPPKRSLVSRIRDKLSLQGRFLLQQLHIELVPQCIRTRYPNELDSALMERYRNLYCGSLGLFLHLMKQSREQFYVLGVLEASKSPPEEILKAVHDGLEQVSSHRMIMAEAHQVGSSEDCLMTFKYNRQGDLVLFAKITLAGITLGVLAIAFEEQQTFINLYHEIETDIWHHD